MSQKSTKYFNKLNYTLANEDTGFELSLLKKRQTNVIVSVCGSGGRSLPLITAPKQKLYCVDLVPQQLKLCELREAAIRTLSFEEFLEFFGFPPYGAVAPSRRKELFDKLNLSPESSNFFKNYFKSNHWHSLLLDGKWEKTFDKISKVVRFIVGKSAVDIFAFENLSDQKTWLASRFPWARWKYVLKIVGNATFFNALLYKGSFVKKNIPISYFDFYFLAYKKLFELGPVRENFFMQMSYLGHLRYPEGNPIEAQKDCFETMKGSLLEGSQVVYKLGSIIDVIKSLDTKADFVSLSDVPSYFGGELEKNFLQDMAPGLNTGAWVVLRSYLRVPEKMNLEGYKEITNDHLVDIQSEKTQMYQIQIFEKV